MRLNVLMNVAKGSRDLSMVWLLFKHKLLHQSYILHTWPQFVGFFFYYLFIDVIGAVFQLVISIIWRPDLTDVIQPN